MKTIISAIALGALTATLYAAEPQNGSGEKDGYKLVWQDLFDASTLNLQRWNVEVTPNPANSELQYYTDRSENVSVGDDGAGNSCLILTARRESYGGRNFTSGRVNSNNKVNFTYGKIEAAIKLPKTANGLWPAFWMMGDDIDEVGWPRCGELDIFEMGHADGIRNGTSERFLNGAAHWGYYIDGGYPNYARHSTADYSLQDGQFHLYTCIWTPNKVSMYLDLDRYPDAAPYYEIGIDHTGNPEDWSTDIYYRKPNFILFNLAVGGHFPNIYDANGVTALNDANGQEARYYVNYVKVYQRDADGGNMWSAVAGDSGTGGDDPDTPDTPDDPESGIDTVIDSQLNAPVEYYNLQGIRVNNPRPGDVLIRRQGSKTMKIVY